VVPIGTIEKELKSHKQATLLVFVLARGAASFETIYTKLQTKKNYFFFNKKTLLYKYIHSICEQKQPQTNYLKLE
jgi:hypothetical protein